MRIWVKPDQLAKLGITVPDVDRRRCRRQNAVNPAGQIGAEPAPPGQEFTYTVRAQGRLSTPEEFGEIVVRANPDGSMVRLQDVARIELGAQIYNLEGRLNGEPAAIIAVYQLPGSNAIDDRQRRARRLMDAAEEALSRRTWTTWSALDTTLAVTAGDRRDRQDAV